MRAGGEREFAGVTFTPAPISRAAADARYVKKAGDTMTGGLAIGANPFASGALIVVAGAAANMDLLRYGNIARYNAYRVDGTVAVPTAIVLNDGLGAFQLGGYDGVGMNVGALVQGLAAENWSNVAHGAHLDFYTTAVGSTTNVRRWRMLSSAELVPSTDNAYDLGQAAFRIRNLFTAGTVRHASLAGVGTRAVVADASGNLSAP